MVMLTYPGNIKDDYILARISQVHPDSKGLVRRVSVKFRKKNMKEPRDTCKSRMVEEVVAVQKLVLLESAPSSSAVESHSKPVSRSMVKVPPSSESPSSPVDTSPGGSTF